MHHLRFLAALVFSVLAVAPALAERLELKVASAQQSFDPQTAQPVVAIKLDEESARAFADFTVANVGKIIDIYVGDEVQVSPIIRDRIDNGEVSISGSMSAESATELSISLSRGDAQIFVELQD